MITSVRNPRVKWVRGLQARSRARREEGAFVVEGVRLTEEALVSGWPAQLVLHTDDLDDRGRAVVAGFASRDVETLAVTPEVMGAASDTETPQGILAVLAAPVRALPPPADFVLLVDRVRDPGNVGTILRTAAAAGVQAALLAPGTVDPYAPKVLRAGMGAHFRLPVYRLDWEAIRDYVQSEKLRAVLASAGEGEPYTRLDWTGPVALVIGGEAAGAGGRARELVEACVHIPMPGEMESLNAAVAAAVLLFEIVRQREQAGGPSTRTVQEGRP